MSSKYYHNEQDVKSYKVITPYTDVNKRSCALCLLHKHPKGGGKSKRLKLWICCDCKEKETSKDEQRKSKQASGQDHLQVDQQVTHVESAEEQAHLLGDTCL